MSHAQATVLRDGRRPSATRRRLRSELRPRPKEEAMSHALATVRHRARRARVTLNSKLLTLNLRRVRAQS